MCTCICVVQLQLLQELAAPILEYPDVSHYTGGLCVIIMRPTCHYNDGSRHVWSMVTPCMREEAKVGRSLTSFSP